MKRLIKVLFFALLVKPLVLIGLGLNIVKRSPLPKEGAAILAANHTSHLDTLVLMSLYPLSQIHRVRPVAAADYFLRNRWIRWFAIHCIDIIPMDRSEKGSAQSFKNVLSALEHGEIIILFPEGTRALTEDRDFKLKRGIHCLVKKMPDVTVHPVILRGLSKALPKGEALFVPFNCDVILGEPLMYHDDAAQYLAALSQTYQTLLTHCVTK
ncbi:1-acyl-sn-glycerol-3-phosphate acyltransferase [Wohlfahrtiimonas sp. G9077]|uniref:lysophospholipid acyltransferase family protein n=1 Tax=Wohlfahrtiimonas sp. G9077 TaxID=1980118 RepID=UPI000B98032D|nr:lysophospholipid acyltransferase family protein [Wohlfahrtiimonas sp. G9077]OYQ75700.1 1-acyl-sn-glycerol-3-phosphate acyltransferase [Wohlfahrtiimonas sp. G9077]